MAHFTFIILHFAVKISNAILKNLKCPSSYKHGLVELS
jgi:hypothetical protein